MIKIEIKRLLKRPSFYVALLVGIAITALEALTNNQINLKSENFSTFSSGVYSNFIQYSLGKYVRMLQMVFPLIVTIAFSDAYLEDVKSGFIKNIVTRYDKKKYLINRFLVNFVVSGLIISIPLIVNYMIYAATIPSIEPQVSYSSLALDSWSFLPYIYYEYPLLHAFIRIMLLFIYGGSFSSIALAISIFFRSKYVITIIPFIVYIGMDVIYSMTVYSGYDDYSPMLYLFSQSRYNHMFALFPLIVVATCFYVFLAGGMKNELN